MTCFFLYSKNAFILYQLHYLIDNGYKFVLKLTSLLRLLKLQKQFRNLKEVDVRLNVKYANQACTICLKDLDYGKVLSCDHAFHSDCLWTYILNDEFKLCPNCRSP